MPYRIERSLKRAEREVGKPLCAKYQVLRDRLFTQEYAHWATGFPGGNDHGPEHVKRVLEKFDQLIDGNPARLALLRPYELFLAMLSILYHDIGLLKGRERHADTSALLVGDEHNDYLIDAHDRDVIKAAVVSHSSSKDIAKETAEFPDEELIGGQSVRPRVIAALVRLADELDEDYRRADPTLQSRLDLPEESRFFWEFCQRIGGIKPDLASYTININVKFTADDVGWNVVVNGRQMPFIVAFGDKLAKINKELRTVNHFLPEALRYRSLKLFVKPLPRRSEWKHPREFVFVGHTSAAEFVAAFPELLAEPANGWLVDTLDLMRAGDLDRATATLDRLGEVVEYVPYLLRLRYLYDAACLTSLKADRAQPDGDERAQLLQSGLDHLFRWLDLLLDGTARAEGVDPYNEIHKMGTDSDLCLLLSEHREAVLQRLPEKLRPAVPNYPLQADDVLRRPITSQPEQPPPIPTPSAGDLDELGEQHIQLLQTSAVASVVDPETQPDRQPGSSPEPAQAKMRKEEVNDRPPVVIEDPHGLDSDQIRLLSDSVAVLRDLLTVAEVVKGTSLLSEREAAAVSARMQSTLNRTEAQFLALKGAVTLLNWPDREWAAKVITARKKAELGLKAAEPSNRFSASDQHHPWPRESVVELLELLEQYSGRFTTER
jgi:hypothetical protein